MANKDRSYVVCHQANGSVAEPKLKKFAKLEDALKSVSSNAVSNGVGKVSIACVEDESTTPNLNGKARYHLAGVVALQFGLPFGVSAILSVLLSETEACHGA